MSTSPSSGREEPDRRERPDGRVGTPDGLSDREREVLDFERQWWLHAGVKEQEIRERFGVSATRYYQQLTALLDRPEALAHSPLLVRRLRRVRDTRRADRSAARASGQ